MCGIAGRVNFVSGAPVDASVIRAMCGLISHRGPDGQGVHCEDRVGFGHRRLAVIDLSALGAQPMRTSDGTVTITFNGEIYNYLELRNELIRTGHAFRSGSDTEVMLAAYREWGPDFVERLAGMFAFALWDAPRRRLVMARDRVGKKPLFYRTDADGLSFASEPKAFLAEPGFTATPDLQAISQYLSFQYVPSPRSAFRGVEKLPPAHLMVVEDGRMTLRRYWKLSYAGQRTIGEDDAVEQLDGHLRTAVKRRLISDVPLGAFLSGGIDSGLVVSYMAELAPSVKTFSIGFAEREYNELPAARLVAEKFGTDHVEFVVEPRAVDLLPQLVWHYGEPYADSSALPTYVLSGLTRRHVTVALNGDGGDESFAGYDRYFAIDLARRLTAVPAALRRMAAAGGRVAEAVAPHRQTRRLHRFLRGASTEPRRQYASWMMHFDPALRDELVTQDFRAATADDAGGLVDALFATSDAATLVEQSIDADVRSYLPDDLLVKVDIATMAHGLEGRSPFLDHELMEFAARLPLDLKLRGRVQKSLLRKLAARRLPPALQTLPKKGFGVPIDHWFRRELGAFAKDLLFGQRARSRGYFNRPVVERLFAEHESGARQWHFQLWNLLMLELWFQMFIDRRPDGPPPAAAATGIDERQPAVARG
jgi:asparagine synthase (glutamine-hydrolysing)